MKKARLNNGIVMPSIGFGVYQIPANETERCVSDALEVGNCCNPQVNPQGAHGRKLQHL